jgi:palmitoyltransferase
MPDNLKVTEASGNAAAGPRRETIEERCFSAALICLEGYYTGPPPIGPLTMTKVVRMVSQTLEKTINLKDVR